jgi:hypothetical protein
MCTLTLMHTQPMPLIPRFCSRKQGEESERTRRAIKRETILMKSMEACGNVSPKAQSQSPEPRA